MKAGGATDGRKGAVTLAVSKNVTTTHADILDRRRRVERSNTSASFASRSVLFDSSFRKSGRSSGRSASVVPVRPAAIYWVFCIAPRFSEWLAAVGHAGTSTNTHAEVAERQTHQLEGLAVAIP